MVDILDDDRQRDVSVHQRYERHWLGGLKIPFQVVYKWSKVIFWKRIKSNLSFHYQKKETNKIKRVNWINVILGRGYFCAQPPSGAYRISVQSFQSRRTSVDCFNFNLPGRQPSESQSGRPNDFDVISKIPSTRSIIQYQPMEMPEQRSQSGRSGSGRIRDRMEGRTSQRIPVSIWRDQPIGSQRTGRDCLRGTLPDSTRTARRIIRINWRWDFEESLSICRFHTERV